MSTRIVREERAVNALNFFSNLQYALIVYFIPVFLVSRGVGENSIGLVFSAASLVSMILLLVGPGILRLVGNYHFFTTLTALMAVALLVIGPFQSPAIAITCFIAITVAWALTMLSLDEFLQVETKETENTGFVRAVFITMANIAFVIAPIVAGHLTENEDFTSLFIVAALISAPMLLISGMGLAHFKDVRYRSFSIVGMWKILRERAVIRSALFQKFLLYVFYGIIEVYVIVYLHDHLDFSLPDIGAMLSLALIAFILVEIPAGYLADTRIGERDILICGFIVLAVTTIGMGLIGHAGFAAWTALMFMTRVGAALVEIGGESYFFKQVRAQDSDEVGLYRAVAQLGLIVGPLIGSLVLLVAHIEIIFVVIGMIMFAGLPSTLKLFKVR